MGSLDSSQKSNPSRAAGSQALQDRGRHPDAQDPPRTLHHDCNWQTGACPLTAFDNFLPIEVPMLHYSRNVRQPTEPVTAR